ncbi:DUF6193 family natural product biosynthesis protein [Kitasatospora arboriphila]|uniref:Uncharacterized protein n=1 Tax=Kitasatospora arboriphila TaxID=258052 RepID=A0ABN1TF49_9ACTN
MNPNSTEPTRCDPPPVNCDLYPDLASGGGLAAVLQETAAELGLSLGDIDVDDRRPLTSARTNSENFTTWIDMSAVERRFFFGVWINGTKRVWGATDDVRELARAWAAWRSGMTAREIQAAAPFVEVAELAEAHERGPAEATALSWELLLAKLRRIGERYGYPNGGAQLAAAEAAYGEPLLRQLFPFTSHFQLHFSTCTGFPYSWDVPYIEPSPGGRYRIHGPARGVFIGEANTAEQAVRAVVRGLPEGCGPAVAGTAVPVQR